MKKLALFLFLVSIVFASCSKKDVNSPHLIAIPKDATLVINIKAKSTVEKAGLNKIKELKSYEIIKKEIAYLPDNNQKIIEDFLDNTRSSGLNLDEIFMFLHEDLTDNKAQTFAVSLGVDNSSKFEKFIKTQSDGLFIEDKGTYKVCFLDGDSGFKWNDKVCFFMFNNLNPDSFIVNEDKTNSIIANEYFKKDYEKNNDFLLYFDYGALMKLVSTFSGVYDLPSNIYTDQFDGFYMTASCNVVKGALEFSATLYPEELVKGQFGDIYNAEFNTDIFKYFPNKSLLALKFAVNPTEIYKKFKEEYEKSVSPADSVNVITEEIELLDENGNVVEREYIDLSGSASFAFSNPILAMTQIADYLNENDAKIKEVLSRFDGSVLGSIFEFESGIIPMPKYGVALGIVNGKEAEVIEMLKKCGFVENTDGYYVFTKDALSVFFALKDKIAYFTGDIETLNQFLAKGYSSDITSIKEVGSKIKKSASNLYVNLNLDDYPAMLRMTFSLMPFLNPFVPFVEQLDYMNCTTNEAWDRNEGILKFKDNSVYPSKLIVDLIDKLVVENFVVE